MTTANRTEEFENFNDAMNTILRADPAKVKAAVDAQIRAHTAERMAKGERKRGRKPKKSSASARAAAAKS